MSSPTDEHIVKSFQAPALIVGKNGQIEIANEAASAVYPKLAVESETDRIRITDLLPAFSVFLDDSREVIPQNGLRTRPGFSCVALAEGDGISRYLVLLDTPDAGEAVGNSPVRRQKMEMVGELAASIAHDLNNPINGIMNYAQLIHDRLDPSNSLKKFAGEILVACDRLAISISDLMKFCRIDEEPSQFFSPQDMFESVKNLLGSSIRKSQINLEITIAEDVSSIYAGSSHIKQVLLNLIINARESLDAKFEGYSEEKRLTISADNFEDSSGEWVRVIVLDAGVGIEKDRLTDIFSPGFTTKDPAKHLGLGLAVASSLIKKSGGRIDIESTPGECFQATVLLPKNK